MAVRDYMTASPGMRGKAARKTQIQISRKPDTTQQISRQKMVFTKGHDGIAK